MTFSVRDMTIVLAAAVLGAHSAFAEPNYVGSQACGKCHQEEYTSWKASAHARAGRRLSAKRKPQAKCLVCHSTGGMPTGRPIENAVGCEACHGAGRWYSPADVMKNPVLSKALGLAVTTTAESREELCGRCHVDETKLRAFDAARGWKSISH
jgi:ribosomal protein S27AE